MSYNNSKLNKGSIQHKSDIVFFETLLFFMAKVLQPAFEDEMIKDFEEELNRLFRTNLFNISNAKKSKFPLVHKIQNSKPNIQAQEAYTSLRPYYEHTKIPINKMYKRSPLMSVLFPSPAEEGIKSQLTFYKNFHSRAKTAAGNKRSNSRLSKSFF